MREYYENAKYNINLAIYGTGTALILNVLVPVHDKYYIFLVEQVRYRTDNRMNYYRTGVRER